MDRRDLQAGRRPGGFWHRARLGLVARLLQQEVTVGPSRILSLGCGTGTELAALSTWGPVTAVDHDRQALALLSRPDCSAVSLADVSALPFAAACFDVAVALDVLEHVGDDHRAVDQVLRVLRPGGLLLVTVPAMPGLFGPHDRALGHCRRYDRQAVRRLLAHTAGLQVRGWNGLLLPAIALRRYGQRGAAARIEAAEYPSWLDRALGGVLNLESCLLARGWGPPLGLSWVAWGRRR
jgi:SAM-dependent methyltransferase